MEPLTTLAEHAFPSGRTPELSSRWRMLHRSRRSASSGCCNTANECGGLRSMLISPAQAAPHEGIRCVRCVPNEAIALRPGGSDGLSSLQATENRLLLWSSWRGRPGHSDRVGTSRRDYRVGLTRSALHRLERAVAEDRKARAGVGHDARGLQDTGVSRIWDTSSAVRLQRAHSVFPRDNKHHHPIGPCSANTPEPEPGEGCIAPELAVQDEKCQRVESSSREGSR
jgi:hypothetical protein